MATLGTYSNVPYRTVYLTLWESTIDPTVDKISIPHDKITNARDLGSLAKRYFYEVLENSIRCMCTSTFENIPLSELATSIGVRLKG